MHFITRWCPNNPLLHTRITARMKTSGTSESCDTSHHLTMINIHTEGRFTIMTATRRNRTKYYSGITQCVVLRGLELAGTDFALALHHYCEHAFRCTVTEDVSGLRVSPKRWQWAAPPPHIVHTPQGTLSLGSTHTAGYPVPMDSNSNIIHTLQVLYLVTRDFNPLTPHI